MAGFVLKKGHKILLWIFICLTAILFAVPRVGKWYLEKHSRELIGRDLEINKIRFNYFTGTLRIHDLKLFESDGKTVFLSFKRLKINIDYLPLFKNEFFVKYITLDDPYVEVLQNGSKFNFDDLVSSSDTAEVKKDTVPSAPTKYIINNISIARGYVKYTDQQLNHTIAMNRLDLKIPGFTWNSDSTNLNVDFNFVDGGGLKSKLAINQADSTYSVNLQLDSLNLNIIEPYIKSSMYISSLKGWLSNNIDIRGNMNSVMQLFVRGVNHIFGFQMNDTLNRPVFSFSDLAVDIDTILLAKNRFAIKSVSLKDPYILFEMIDTTNNWMALMKPEAAPADTSGARTDTSKSSLSYSYTFPKLDISGGKVLFADKTMRYPFEYNISDLNIECSGAPGNPGRLLLKMSAGLNGTGTLSGNAVVNPANPEDMDLSLAVGEFRMKDMEPYFMHYLGYPVNGGILNFKTDDKIRPSALSSDNSIYFRKFTLAKRTDNKCEYKIPVRLALGVLSDRNGIIDIKAPVETKGDEVRVKNLGKIIFRIIGNLFVKAAVSPFTALSGSYNVDPSKLQEIRLDLLKPSPDEDNLKSVDILADIITKKPGLNVDLYYTVNRVKAADSLAYLLSAEEFRNYSRANGVSVRTVADSSLSKYLIAKLPPAAALANPDVRLLCMEHIGKTRLDAALDSLRNIQAAFLTSYLGIDKALAPERFRVITVAPDTVKPALNYPAFRVYVNAGD